MRARVGTLFGAALSLAVVGSLVIGIPALAKSGAPQLAAAPAKKAAPVLAAVAVDLYICADEFPAGLTLPDGVSVDIWGFSEDTNGATAGGCSTPTLPGPVLTADEGDDVTVNVTNNLADPVSLVVPGQTPESGGVPVPPGSTSVAGSGGTGSFTFTDVSPGTHIYEASDERQKLMGLYGALIVRPTDGAIYAYNDPATEFDAEETLVLSEIDPDFNAGPAGFDLLDYAPQYWLINGEAYPDTDPPISIAGGDRLLLRYVNAGSTNHTMALLGAHQRIIAREADPLLSHEVVADTIASGQTLDVITEPCGPASTRVALYNSNLRLTNGDLSSVPHSGGGMMTFIELSSAGSCAVGPNTAPIVDAGPDQTLDPDTLPGVAYLDGTITDDFVEPVTVLWTQVSGPAVVVFGDPTAVDTIATFPVVGTYELELTADDDFGTFVVSDTVTITVNALLYFSTVNNVAVPGVPSGGGTVAHDDSDIYSWGGGTTYSRIFNAESNGVPAAADVDAVVVEDMDTFYMSFLAATTLPGVGAVAPSDIVKFDLGTWTMFFDGSDVGLTVLPGENVDAFDILSATEVAVSTVGTPDVGIAGFVELDEDLLKCTGTFGAATTCAWSVHMDGSDVGLSNTADEDVDGATVVGSAVYLTTVGPFSVTGATGQDEDVFGCSSLGTGPVTSCPGGWSLFFDGSIRGVTDDLDAIDRP